ncbi:Spore germination protein B3 precursor [Sporotomaculum syntrophicum]|uniref:Spore germination protein B3 n=1 Tax=Sporotomaculum syntrophicum TaxID=182264 RepID=A0A9D2WPX2_9FIRM|nr:Ger(x)C family spore germination protein [Sporotomaculum syntrophicum]KAF1084442.1 Spore germination protein B3 precursor [Sporotomaculum syntrophicum]
MLKNSRQRLTAALLILLVLLFAAGCGSNSEPDALSYVLLIGIDHGAQNLLRVSYLIAVPKVIAGGGQEGAGGGGGEGQRSANVITIEAPSIYASMNMVNSFVGRRISLMHAKGIIFSEAMAKDGSMGVIVPGLTQFRETRGTAFIAVARQKPEEILNKMTPFLETNPAKYIELLAGNQSFTGYIPGEKLQDFYNDLKIGGINPVALLFAVSNEKLPPHNGQSSYRSEGDYVAGEMVKKGGVSLEAMGAAVFRGGKMVGTLNGDETSIYSMFRGQYGRRIYTIKDPLKPGKLVIMDVSQTDKPRIKVKLTEEGPIIEARLSLEGNVLGVNSLIDYSLPRYRPVLEQAFEELIEQQARELVEKTQHEYRSDIFGFGNKALRLVLTQRDWEQLNWAALYEEAQVSVDVEYKIRRTGTQLRLMPIARSNSESIQ